MNTENLIDQLNKLVDQAPQSTVNNTVNKLLQWAHHQTVLGKTPATKTEIKENLGDLIHRLTPARSKIREQNLTAHQTETAMFNIMKSISTVDERTTNPDVIEYAEHLALEIMLAAKINIDDV